MDHIVRKRVRVEGIVQGVGFRPYVYRLAKDCALTGFVRNDGDGVTIEVQGVRVDEFVPRLIREAPPLVLVTDVHEEALAGREETDFVIVASEGTPVASAMIPADVATCDDCLADIRDPENRRYRYPFTNCTNCGPRYTITASIPYDRPSTSMKDFPMCEDCAREYGDPDNRRFHAQPNACPVCGPTLKFVRNARLHGCDVDLEGDAALRAGQREVAEGRILALRGLGGYHLAVDAKNEHAVHLLRVRKHRYQKPLAVMLRDVEAVRRICTCSTEEEALLQSPQRPIVILQLRERHGIAPSVSLDNPTLGVMLPYTPLHHILLDGEADILVMTSGNISEEPICIRRSEAATRLEDIADAFLHHNREILQRCDDSVFRVIASEPRPMRRARGYVPRPVLLPSPAPSVLAVGAELKNTACVTKGRAAFLTQHVGDLENLEALGFFEESVTHLLDIFAVEPAAIAHDLHPDYLGTQWSRGLLPSELQRRLAPLPRIPVQHHHAHLAACLAENGRSGEDAIGVILDGTGYGTDCTIWGGEFLLGSAKGYERMGHFMTTAMPGANAAVRAPWRMAASLLHAAFGTEAFDALEDWSVRRTKDELQAVRFSLEENINAPLTSSCGRLFDAVASLVGLHDTVDFEAQAAIALEFAAGTATDEAFRRPYTTEIQHPEGRPIVLSFLPAIREITEDIHVGISPGIVSARFHAAVISGCVQAIEEIAAASGLRTVALSGGSFQNALLLEGMQRALTDRGFTVLTHTEVPANDGGIALGQAVIAQQTLRG